MPREWKVLIADDEAIIREGIRHAVNWGELNLHVVGEAEDGEEALEMALEHQIDILLVDLNMPIMNGITLMKHIRERLSSCRIIVITGHDEFTYAQEAIRLQVDDYILKPANPEQLRNVLKNCTQELSINQKQNEYLAMSSKQIQKNIPLLRERFFLEWLEGEMTEEEIVEQLHFLQLPVSCPIYLGIIRWSEFQDRQPTLNETDRQLYLYAIENIAKELIGEEISLFFRDHAGLLTVCVWQTISESVWHQIVEAVFEFLEIKISLHYESIDGELSRLPTVYQVCKTSLYKELQMSPMVKRAKEYIEEHFADTELSLETIAQNLQVSPVYLSRMIKQEVGTSFVNILTHLRINKAIQLLHNTDQSIQEIAELVGYDTQHYFSTSFKKMMGITPSQHRKRQA